jgi:squalene-associated FAD-dependent desaturase
MAETVAPRLAIIGAGWAGLACAVELVNAGVSVTVFESNTVPGGRARRVDLPNGTSYDNGQHLLLGAYQECLRLIRAVNPQPVSVLFDRFPLVLGNSRTYGAIPDVLLRKPATPVLGGLLMLARAQGLTVGDRLHLGLFLARLALVTIDDATRTVKQEIASLNPVLQDRIIAPLCLASLNTPIERASAIVFQNVIRASLGAGARSSDMLLPKVDLTALFPLPAIEHIQRAGAMVHLGEVVMRLTPANGGGFDLVTRQRQQHFDHVVVALAPHVAARLLCDIPTAQPVAAALDSLAYEPITTFYSPPQQHPQTTRPPKQLPLYCVDDPRVQWVVPQPKRGFQAVVVSGTEANGDHDRQAHVEHIAGLTQCHPSRIVRISERRATYSCTPQAHARLVTLPRAAAPLWLAGDYCYPDFPATLEAAARSGVKTANDIIAAILK